MSVDLRVLGRGDLEAVYKLAAGLDEVRSGDPFAAWTAPWRNESLEHYLVTGWCVGAFEREGSLKGFALAQPVLFWRRQTQSIWVEYIDGSTRQVAFELAQALVRIGRDKHIQKVVFAPRFGHLPSAAVSWMDEVESDLLKAFGTQLVSGSNSRRGDGLGLEFKTTKVSE